jgi:hypothetical protein
VIGDVVLMRTIAEELPSPPRITRHVRVEQISAISQRATNVASAEQDTNRGGFAVESTAVTGGDALQIEPAVVVGRAHRVDGTAETRPLAAEIERDLGDALGAYGGLGVTALRQEFIRQEDALQTLHQRKVARAPLLTLRKRGRIGQ